VDRLAASSSLGNRDRAEDLLVDGGLGATGRHGGLLIGCGRGAQSRGGGPPGRRRTKDTGAAWRIACSAADLRHRVCRKNMKQGGTADKFVTSIRAETKNERRRTPTSRFLI
jgi:hypothetical protein